MINYNNDENRLDLFPLLSVLLKKYFSEIREHARNGTRKVAWCSSAAPVELLRAMDFEVYFPEKHWELLGPLEAASDLELVNEKDRIEPKFHSYLTADHITRQITRFRDSGSGTLLSDDIPEPDILVYNTIQGKEVKDWLDWYAKKLGKPVIGLYAPYNLGEINEFDIKSVVTQFRDMILPLEAISGKKFDIDRLRAVVKLSRKCAELWKSCLKMSAYLPAPWSYFDHLIFMFPAVVLRGNQSAIDFYELLFTDILKRVKQGTASVCNEQVRLLWDGLPLRTNYGELSATLKSLDACVVASTCCNGWDLSLLEEDQPLASMARAYSSLCLGRSADYQYAYIHRLMKEYRVNGILFNNTEAGSQVFTKSASVLKRLASNMEIPVFEINQGYGSRMMDDKIDLAGIEGFVEQICEGK